MNYVSEQKGLRFNYKHILYFLFEVLLLTASIICVMSCVGIVTLRFLVVDLVEFTFSDWEYVLRRPRGYGAPILYIVLVVLPYLLIFYSGWVTYMAGHMVIMEIEGFFRTIKRKIERKRPSRRLP